MNFYGAISFVRDIIGFTVAAFWGPSFINDDEDYMGSPPLQQPSPISQSQRIEEWRQQAWESIKGYAQALQDPYSQSKGKIQAIMIRHYESFDDIKDQLEEIQQGGNDVTIREWAESWVDLIDAIVLKNLSRNSISTRLCTFEEAPKCKILSYNAL